MLITGCIIITITWIASLAIVDRHPLFMIGILLTILSFIFIIIGSDNGSYKKGQIDAINGTIQWELQEQEDSSVKWIEVENAK